MVSRTQVTERYYKSYFDTDSAFTELGDYVTSSETIRTVFHIGDKFRAWNEMATKVVEEIRLQVSIPREDYGDHEGILTQKIGEKINIINQDTLEIEETYRIDDMINQNRWITLLSVVLEKPKKKGMNS